MARRTSVAHFSCSIARTLDVVGDWWTLLVVREVTLGRNRFDLMQAELGIARNVLAERLAWLVDQGVLERRRYQERPERFEYVLTEKGDDLFPVLMSLWAWGDRWAAGPDGPPRTLVHRPDEAGTVEAGTGEARAAETGAGPAKGHVCRPEVVCHECGQRLTRRTTRITRPRPSTTA